jgi:hypothetical protein
MVTFSSTSRLPWHVNKSYFFLLTLHFDTDSGVGRVTREGRLVLPCILYLRSVRCRIAREFVLLVRLGGRGPVSFSAYSFLTFITSYLFLSNYVLHEKHCVVHINTHVHTQATHTHTPWHTHTHTPIHTIHAHLLHAAAQATILKVIRTWRHTSIRSRSIRSCCERVSVERVFVDTHTHTHTHYINRLNHFQVQEVGYTWTL